MNKNGRKKGLLKQVTRFRMHKSGKFWVFSSLTQSSWLNFSKKSTQQIKVKTDIQESKYQQVYDKESENTNLSQGVKWSLRLATGVGLSLLGGHLKTTTFAETSTPTVEKNLDTQTLAEKDSTTIPIKSATSNTLQSNEELSEKPSAKASDLATLTITYTDETGVKLADDDIDTFNPGDNIILRHPKTIAVGGVNYIVDANKSMMGEPGRSYTSLLQWYNIFNSLQPGIVTSPEQVIDAINTDGEAARAGQTIRQEWIYRIDQSKFTAKDNTINLGETFDPSTMVDTLTNSDGTLGDGSKVTADTSLVDFSKAGTYKVTLYYLDETSVHQLSAEANLTIIDNSPSTSESSSESISISDSESISASESDDPNSDSKSESSSESISISDSESISASESDDPNSDSKSESSSESISISDSESISASESDDPNSDSKSESSSESISISDSESISASESDDPNSDSKSESSSESISISDSESISASESDDPNSESKSE
ncbi:bacterial Ig-like domain-containing protein, partial [Lactococcus petauri]